MTRRDAVRLAAGLTASRLLAAPLVAGLLLFAAANPDAAGLARFSALTIFVLAALTDLADGFVARRFDAATPLGAALDHAADKALTGAALIALSATLFPPYLAFVAVLLIVRDLVVAGLREGLALGGRQLPVDRTGKWKAAMTMIGVVAALVEGALLAWPASGIADAAYLLTHAALLAALALSLWSAGLYLRQALRPDAAA